MEGIAHLGRIIHKIWLRHTDQIQEYTFMTVGFDPYLLFSTFLNSTILHSSSKCVMGEPIRNS